ncbi:hypothetical protein [Streptomyces endocoffeicus]|uniref:hypothetical protein n=1 Tax=Streptomyces endocoffeicus TaxID=2898945 RepID=UPI0027DAD5AC|nr:hypothetical protein [Streptomyces endocoffeicus]
MTATLTAPERIPLTPSADNTPVVRTIVQSIAADHDPETYLRIVLHRPDGGANLRHAWTEGGEPLGDEVDRAALAAGMDAADWLHIGDLNCTRSTRGRITVEAYALRPVLADVSSGIRSPADRRDGLVRVIQEAARQTGQTPCPGLPRWLGMGPALVNRPTP